MYEDEETTKLMHTMMIGQDNDEDDDILENIEEFEESLDYLDIDDEKKKEMKNLCKEIKRETNEKTRSYLFDLLQKELN